MEILTIRQIIESVESGQLRIPAFQRGFVWEPDRVAFLMDSVYKDYPFGALLFWRTNEKLKVERKLGPFELPEPKADYPIDYVLDGQQRVTAIYATFQISKPIVESETWKDIYFDYSVPDAAQETQFFALTKAEVDSKKHLPLRVLFDTPAYRKATKNFDDKLATRIDELQTRFKEVRIPVQMFKTDDKGTVAVIFERINRQGVPLNTVQLLSAWTWSEDFQLQKQFEDLIEDLDAFGFSNGFIDENLILRCTSAILVANPRPEAIVELPGNEVRNRFDEVLNGIKGALDFLKSNLRIQKFDNLPFQTILVPLSVFFAVSGNEQIVVSDKQRSQLVRWFWRTCVSRRYSSGVIRNLEEDIKAMLQLKGGQASNLGNFHVEITPQFFLENSFNIGTVNTKTFIMLLAAQNPLSFVSGTALDLAEKLKEYNRTEFHHLMPRAHVKVLGETKQSMNALANYCFLSKSENQHLGGDAPSIYRKKMAQNIKEILQNALCPESLFKDVLDSFLEERSVMLTDAAKKLCG